MPYHCIVPMSGIVNEEITGTPGRAQSSCPGFPLSTPPHTLVVGITSRLTAAPVPTDRNFAGEKRLPPEARGSDFMGMSRDIEPAEPEARPAVRYDHAHLRHTKSPTSLAEARLWAAPGLAKSLAWATGNRPVPLPIAAPLS